VWTVGTFFETLGTIHYIECFAYAVTINCADEKYIEYFVSNVALGTVCTECFFICALLQLHILVVILLFISYAYGCVYWNVCISNKLL
jgi:hypothetical protein